MNKLIAFILIAVASSVSAQEAELGRLFFSPNERAQLERLHVLSTNETDNNRHSLVVNGMIQRDGGKRIIWINGEQQAAGSADSRAPTTVPVILPGKSAPVDVKVGQRLILDSPAQPSTKPAPNDDD